MKQVPDGYALIGKDALRSWGKLELIESMCQFPIKNELKGKPCVNNGGPAFPSTEPLQEQTPFFAHSNGMTLRDYFAAKAMQALIHVQVRTSQTQRVETAYEWADAMLKARQKV